MDLFVFFATQQIKCFYYEKKKNWKSLKRIVYIRWCDKVFTTLLCVAIGKEIYLVHVRGTVDFFDCWLLFEEIIIARNYCVERLLIFLSLPTFFVLNMLCIFSTPYVRKRMVCFVLALCSWELDCTTRQIEFWLRIAMSSPNFWKHFHTLLTNNYALFDTFLQLEE